MGMHDTQEPGATRRGEVIDDRTTVRTYAWDWSDAGQRRGLPWLGVFLVVFGALLLVRTTLPEYAGVGSLVTLALGIVLLAKWALDRSAFALYAGALVSALGAPDLLEATGLVGGPGLGALCLGIAFLAIAAVRAATRGGVGWQAYLGLILAVIGGSQLAIPAISGLVLPAILVIGGFFLLARANRA